MQIKTMQLGQIGTNCYILADEQAKVCAVIDPGDSGEAVAQAIRREGWTPTAILLTHSHFDHILGIPGLRAVWPDLPVYCHPEDMADHADSETIFGMRVPTVWSFGNLIPYNEGDQVRVGSITLTVLHTPGHSKGSVTLMTDGVLFTGDTLFRGSMGRTDLAGGDFKAIMRSLARLARLEGDYKVCPGHESTSTLDYERRTNYCVREALERA